MIYVNGDSYACVSDGKRFSEFLSEHYGCEAVNNGIPGACNARIFRTSLRDLLELKKTHTNIKAVLNLTFPMRTEVWDKDILHNQFVNDGEFTSLQMHNSKNWFYDKLPILNGPYSDYYKQFINFYNVEAETVKILQNIILISTWCKLNKIQLVLLSGPLQEPIDFTAPFVYNFYQAVKQDTQVIDIFQQSFTQWCLQMGFEPIDDFTQEIHGKVYQVGHHGEAAHKSFANYLIENYFA